MSTNSWLGFLLKLIESGGDGARILRQLREQLELPNWSYLPGHRHQQGWPGWWLGKFGGKFGRRVCQLHASDQQCQFPRGLQVMSTSYHQAWYCEENKGEENKAKFIRKIKKTISTKGGCLIYPWCGTTLYDTVISSYYEQSSGNLSRQPFQNVTQPPFFSSSSSIISDELDFNLFWGMAFKSWIDNSWTWAARTFTAACLTAVSKSH